VVCHGDFPSATATGGPREFRPENKLEKLVYQLGASTVSRRQQAAAKLNCKV
jgi:hypothetical protein